MIKIVVSITWSETAGEAAMSDPKDWGNIANGGVASAIELFVSHDGEFAITDCGLYIQPYSGTAYSGSAGTQADYDEIIAWGDTADSTGTSGGLDGGFWINRTDGTPDAGWEPHNADTGISSITFDLPTGMAGITTENEIEGSDGGAEEATFSVRIIVPDYEDTAGTRFFDQVLKYTYTS